MNDKTKNNLKSLLSGMLGAIIILLIYIILSSNVFINSNNINENINNSNDTLDSTSVGRIYDNTVDSVISVVNM